MEVLRKSASLIETEDFEIGDQIKVTLRDYGDFTLTVQEVSKSKKEILVVFDSILVFGGINCSDLKVGGFENSDLKAWMNVTLRNQFPKDFRERIKDITIPSYGQIFGQDIYYYSQRYEEDFDNRFILMEDVRNRVASYDGKIMPWWLKNVACSQHGSSMFAYVNYMGMDDYAYSSEDDIGIRPLIIIYI